jgi:tryptophan synthase alpha chain
VTPTTNQDRLKIILNNSSGFLYYVSITGITGTKKPEIGPLKESLDFGREFTHLPIAVGFGIKTPKQVNLINEFSDAVVVGSALVNTILNGLENDESDEFIINEALGFISNMKTN